MLYGTLQAIGYPIAYRVDNLEIDLVKISENPLKLTQNQQIPVQEAIKRYRKFCLRRANKQKSFKEGWQKGQALGRSIGGSLRYRAPNNDMYRDNPRAYWQERGKLVTQLARMEAKYEDAIQTAKGLSDVNLIDGL